MVVFRRFKGACLAFLLTALAQAATPTPVSFAVEVGNTREQVLSAYAPPQSRGKNGTKEILVYKEGSIVLENGVVTEVRFPKGEPKRLPTPTPSPSPVAAKAVANTAEANHSNEPRTITAAPAPEAPARLVDPLVWKIGGGLALVVLLLIFHRVTRPGESDVRARIRAAATKKEASPPAPEKGSTPPPSETPAKSASNTPAPRARLSLNKASSALLDRVGMERLEWRRFEELCEGYFVKNDWACSRGDIGNSGTPGYLMTKNSAASPTALGIFKKQRGQEEVSVRVVREAHGLMLAEGLRETFVVTTSAFTAEALQFAEGKDITLISGDDLLSRFAKLPEPHQKEVVAYIFRDDCETPTCPACDIKMTLGGDDAKEWVCKNAPRCKETVRM